MNKPNSTTASHYTFTLKRFSSALRLLIAIAISAFASGTAVASSYDLALPGIALRPNVSVDLSATVFVTPHSNCPGKTVLALHGLAHSAATMGPLSGALFSDPLFKKVVCRVVALDLPGHGKSGLPVGLRFGELLMEDYVAALTGGLNALKAKRIRPRGMIGHSMGGGIIQLTQQVLLNGGSSLRAEYGIRSVVLLAPTIPQPLPWAFAGVTAAEVLSQFIVTDDVLGTYVNIPAPAWTFLFFSRLTPQGTFPAGTPADPVRLGYLSPEALFAGAQVTGAPPFARPTVAANTFSIFHGTVLGLVSLQQDLFLPDAELRPLYQHLTGDPFGIGHVAINHADAVHDMYIVRPDLMVDLALRAVLVP